MHSLRIHKHGGPEVLQIDDLPVPEPVPDQVRVKIKVSSLNHMDIWVRNGLPGIAELPLTLGCDASGVVDKVGQNITTLKTGDRVFLVPLYGCKNCVACSEGRINNCRDFKIPGEHMNGVHSEFVCVPETHAIKLSDNLSFEEGAAFPLTFMTAWHMLVTKGQIKKDMDVLVMAAGSGVGAAGVQIAKHFGARVIATASGKSRLDKLLELGVDFVIDHYSENISARVKEITHKKGVDLILEHVGVKVWDECMKSLGWGGKLVTCGATSGPLVKLQLQHIFIKQQQIIGSTMGTIGELVEIHDLFARGQLKASVAKIFPHVEVRAAHEFLEDSKHSGQFGKVLLSW